MRAIMVMFDTLCRRFLPPYGNDWVIAPNFRRLAERTCQFQNAYVGSMPCMPARREIHTGRYNFLHRSWGPLEPFDDSMPEILSRAGVHTHKVTDHYHYWEDGGATYHNRYTTFDFVRGQEGDPCFGWAGPVGQGACRNGTVAPRLTYGDHRTQDWINRLNCFTSEASMPQNRTFDQGLDFVRRNAGFQDWFCQIETFDPHEPFFTQKGWQGLYPHDWDDTVWDWPNYERVKQDRRAIEHMRCMYAALVSMCDRNLGRVLDLMDEQDLWQDTMLIVNTDHGFLLSEHDWWAKCVMPFYQEVAHIPMWVWDPRLKVAGARRESLVQTIDVAPTLLEFFNQSIPADMQGRPLRQVITDDTPLRQAGLYGIFGGQVNLTDGRWVYMRGPAPDRGNRPLVQYTHMPCHMRSRFSPQEMRNWDKHPGFAFTKGCPVMAIDGGARSTGDGSVMTSCLYDLQADYAQERPVHAPEVEARLLAQMVGLMAATDAPPEQYRRLGLPTPEELRRDPACAGRHLAA